MEAAGSSEMENINQTTWHDIPENTCSHCHHNLKYDKLYIISLFYQ